MGLGDSEGALGLAGDGLGATQLGRLASGTQADDAVPFTVR